MANTFCVTITECKTNGDKATLGFVVANAALGSEKDTMVFLSADGVWAAVTGEVDAIDEGDPFAPLKELVEKFTASMARIPTANRDSTPFRYVSISFSPFSAESIRSHRLASLVP